MAMRPYWQVHNGDTTQTIYQGDALDVLRQLPDESVHCCITSPPYYGLRDYGVGGQIGLEPTPEEYVKRLVEVFREVRRVLRDDGTFWLNLADSYAGRNTGGKWREGSARADGKVRGDGATSRRNRNGIGAVEGIEPKNLIGVPWRVAFALQADGWYLRSDIIWHKPNAMPESVTDRPTRAHEYVFLLTKKPRYFYDAVAIREPATYRVIAPGKLGAVGVNKRNDAPDVAVSHAVKDENATRNKRSVWTIATEPFPEAHFATFPTALVEPMILAGTSPQACPHCGAPWERVVERDRAYDHLTSAPGKSKSGPYASQTGSGAGSHDVRHGVYSVVKTLGWRPTCSCPDNDGSGRCVVLDPFVGSGTTLLVAQRLGRSGIGIELNPDYCAMASRRIDREQWSRCGASMVRGDRRDNAGG